jgi:hypothetical protein
VKSKVLLIPLLSLLPLAVAMYLARTLFARALVAETIYREHIFTPSPDLGQESLFYRLRDETQFYWDFSEIPIARKQRLKQLDPSLLPLVAEMGRRQSHGEDMSYPAHIYREVRWRLNFTSDTSATQARIADLRQALASRSRPSGQASDGSLAPGLNVWYLKLYYSTDHIATCSAPPQYPLTFLDRINSPERLNNVLDVDLNNDFIHTGTFNREELDETFSALARILYPKPVTNCYPFNSQLPATLVAFVNRWQNPTTGYWGQWLIDRHGRVWKMDDMAMTFHVLSDLDGHVSHLDQIARRTIQLENTNFPGGTRFNGHYENHLNWDVVKIFREAWPSLDRNTRELASSEMSRMLTWCLTDSLNRDGSFKVSDLDDTPGDADRYGVEFLTELGYFQPKDRFWSTRDFPESKVVQTRIEVNLKSTGLKDPAIQEAYNNLELHHQ